jgi:pimeloyl-ACP methyl ester carboxylesterase
LLAIDPALRRRSGVLVAALILALVLLAAPARAASSAATVRVDTVCFSVHNTGDPLPSTLYGRRYTVGRPTASTPAIVLVHGIASSTGNWDYTPGFSVARRLAQAGFVVISYDRLGFANSHYDRPKGGQLITTPNQRDMLHQLVGEVKTAAYTVARGADCSSRQTPSTLASPTVVIAGHSAGAAIVQGYPGAYHDVAAMVQSNYSNRGQGPVVGQQIAQVVAPALASGADYVPFFANRQQCEQFNVFAPGAVPSVVRIACDPARFVLTPAGEFTGFPALEQQNDQLVRSTGPIPVLLVYGDHDAAFPADVSQADYDYWVANCPGCDITRYTEQTSGHLFQAHRVMPQWVDEVVSWLASRGIAAR